jgi:zinc protease
VGRGEITVSTTISLFALVIAMAGGATAAAAPADDVVRATLPNGLRVVVIRNPLAPVVTVELNVLAGGDETPPGFPGMAHAQEHMAFRGCSGMSADQTAAIYAQLGGQNNADTQQTITQYFATVPAADFDVALEAQAACLRDIDDRQAQWSEERGAIEQEVARDLSNPTYKFLVRLNEDLFAGTPYAHDALGTKASFDATTGAMLKAFYRRWYVPGAAILVIVGDLDSHQALAKVEQQFGSIPNHAVPARPRIVLQPVKAETFTLQSNLPYTLGFIAYRFPGTRSPDFAAAQILADVLGSQRGDLYAMVPAGKALAAEFGMAENFPEASVGYGLVALPADGHASDAVGEMRTVLNGYAKQGLPEELVEAAKRGEIAAAEFQRNSIPGLANLWSDALAVEGRTSPDEDVDALRRVTVADVNRVARQFLRDDAAITAILQPLATGQPVAGKGFGGAEQLTSAPGKPVKLPSWAAPALSKLTIPAAISRVSDITLPNGLRLIVKSDSASPTVSVFGGINNEPALQTPAGKEGVAELVDGLFSYGTRTLDRLSFQKALDDIAANEKAGYLFSIEMLKEHFDRGIQLLADHELHPALPPDAFEIVRRQASRFVAGNLKSPGYRVARALDYRLLPAGDATLREATPATLANVSLKDLEDYAAATIRPDQATIVIIGDVDVAQAQASVTKWFGDWRATGAKPAVTLPPVPANKAATASVADAQAVQASVILAEELPLNRFESDYYPLQLGNHVLGGGFYATRLYHDLRQVAGYVYTVDVELEASRSRARYVVTYGCDPQNVAKARALIERDLGQMRSSEVSEDELHQAKASLLRQLPLSESSEHAVASGLLRRAELGLPLDEPSLAARKYYALGAADVKAAFEKWVDPQGFVEVVRGPPPQR